MLTPTRMRRSAAPDLGAPVRQRLLHAQAGAHGALGVVLVGDRRAEEGEDGVADDLVDPAAEVGDVGGEPLEAAVDQVLDLLGVACLGEVGEPDEVGEQDGDDAALVGPGRRGRAPHEAQKRAPARRRRRRSYRTLGPVVIRRPTRRAVYEEGVHDVPDRIPP